MDHSMILRMNNVQYANNLWMVIKTVWTDVNNVETDDHCNQLNTLSNALHGFSIAFKWMMNSYLPKMDNH